MNSEDNLNPYAAPQSDVTPPKEAEELSMPRPASTKWLLGFMWFVICGLAGMCYFEYQARGAEFFDAFKSLRSAFSGSLMVLIMVAFHVFKRSRITYTLGIVYLLFWSYIMWSQISGVVRVVAYTWNQEIDKTQIRANSFVLLVFTALFAKLCYHFIFGLPSLRFYRMTQK